ncbi:MAG TPA: hypothetical protein VGQ99_05775 [Tepidisphaeraceae bacterium]|jgi:hypothetical protein|nr:hypothetical protein [Tepidisphaeraceae bacterium]
MSKHKQRPKPALIAPPTDRATYTLTLKPRPKLLLFLSILLAFWIAMLLTMYFTTIYPTRHQRTLPSSVDNPP